MVSDQLDTRLKDSWPVEDGNKSYLIVLVRITDAPIDSHCPSRLEYSITDCNSTPQAKWKAIRILKRENQRENVLNWRFESVEELS